jgi:K+-transporting ATPase ATPase C chain
MKKRDTEDATSSLKPAVLIFITLTFITGIVYPISVFAAGQILFPWQAHGSLIYDENGTVTGSQLIGQQFTDNKYFWPRPSSTGDYPYNPLASGGSNLGPTNKILVDRIHNSSIDLRNANGNGLIPTDLVMSSASGLDPEISADSARFQADRVAKSRGISLDDVNKLIDSYSEKPVFGILGTERVNVILLNKALDSK